MHSHVDHIQTGGNANKASQYLARLVSTPGHTPPLLCGYRLVTLPHHSRRRVEETDTKNMGAALAQKIERWCPAKNP